MATASKVVQTFFERVEDQDVYTAAKKNVETFPLLCEVKMMRMSFGTSLAILEVTNEARRREKPWAKVIRPDFDPMSFHFNRDQALTRLICSSSKIDEPVDMVREGSSLPSFLCSKAAMDLQILDFSMCHGAHSEFFKSLVDKLSYSELRFKCLNKVVLAGCDANDKDAQGIIDFSKSINTRAPALIIDFGDCHDLLLVFKVFALWDEFSTSAKFHILHTTIIGSGSTSRSLGNEGPKGRQSFMLNLAERVLSEGEAEVVLAMLQGNEDDDHGGTDISEFESSRQFDNLFQGACAPAPAEMLKMRTEADLRQKKKETYAASLPPLDQQTGRGEKWSTRLAAAGLNFTKVNLTGTVFLTSDACMDVIRCLCSRHTDVAFAGSMSLLENLGLQHMKEFLVSICDAEIMQRKQQIRRFLLEEDLVSLEALSE